MMIKFVTNQLPCQLPHQPPCQTWRIICHVAAPYALLCDVSVTSCDDLDRHKHYDEFWFVTNVYDIPWLDRHKRYLVTHFLWRFFFRHRGVIKTNPWHKNDLLWQKQNVTEGQISCSDTTLRKPIPNEACSKNGYTLIPTCLIPMFFS